MEKIYKMFNLEPASETYAGTTLLGGVMIGIEHEFEGAGRMSEVDGWERKVEPSLRDSGIEYVFSKPSSGVQAEKLIQAMHEEVLRSAPTVNERTSTHVHIDFRDMTLPDVARFVSMCAVLETTLFELCDTARKNNTFCVPVTESRRMLHDVMDMLRTGSYRGRAMDNSMRYCTINIASIPRFGSIEVRMRDTVTDPEELIFWCNIFLNLKVFVRDWNKFMPSDLVEGVRSRGLTFFMNVMLSPPIWKKIKERVPDANDKVLESIDNLTPYFYNWAKDVEPSGVRNANNVLVARAVSVGELDHLTYLANSYGIKKLIDDIEDYKSLCSGEGFLVSHNGQELYNSVVRARTPLVAGTVLTYEQCCKLKSALERASVVARAGRVIGVHELLEPSSSVHYLKLTDN